MGKTIEVALPAIIGAVAALMVAGIGYWQWHRQQVSRQAEAFRNERSRALRELWNKLAWINSEARTRDRKDFDFFRRELNLVLIREGPFLSQSERALATKYLELIESLRDQLLESGNMPAIRALEVSAPLYQVDELAGALRLGEEAEDISNELGAHLREAVSGRRRSNRRRLNRRQVNLQSKRPAEPPPPPPRPDSNDDVIW